MITVADNFTTFSEDYRNLLAELAEDENSF